MTTDPLPPSTNAPLEAAPAAAETAAPTTEPLRPVKAGEVARCGKKSCRTCFGVGHFMRSNNNTSPAVETVCGCAFSRFMKLNAKRVTYHRETASWFWLD